jgi:hypothetical protein
METFGLAVLAAIGGYLIRFFGGMLLIVSSIPTSTTS